MTLLIDLYFRLLNDDNGLINQTKYLVESFPLTNIEQFVEKIVVKFDWIKFVALNKPAND